MPFLVRDPNYGRTGEVDETFQTELESALRREFGKIEVEYVDAGPGASDPGYFLYFLELVALALTLLAAPSVLAKNLPLWKSYYDKISSFLDSKSLPYFIDDQTAKCLAMFYVLNKIGGGYSNIEVISLLRHGANMAARVQDLTSDQKDERRTNTHYQAVDQAYCRYIACVEVDSNCFTVVVESNGRCGYIAKLP